MIQNSIPSNGAAADSRLPAAGQVDVNPDSDQRKFDSVADWIGKRSWTKKKNDLAPLFWLLNSQTFDRDAAQRIEKWYLRLQRQKSRDTQPKLTEDGFRKRWGDLLEAFELESLPDASADQRVAQTLSCLGAALLLPKLVKLEGKKTTLPVLSSMIATCGQVKIHESKSVVQPWLEQVLAVELPLHLSCHFPDLIVEEDACELAAVWMSSSIHGTLDSDGCPSADLLPVFGPMVASWVRAGELLEKLKWSLKPAVVELLSGAVLHVLRMLRSDRKLMFSDTDSAELTEVGLKRMIKQFGASVPPRLLHRLQDRPDSILSRKIDETPGSPSAWGQSAILRSNWEPTSAHVVLAFAGSNCQCEIGARETLVSGNCNPRVKFDGQEAEALDEYSVTCEEFDEDVNYIELEISLSQDLTLHRQWLLAREEQLLFVADNLVSARPGSLEYACDWPLTSSISVMPETETREIYLRKKKIQSLILPISLPEWLVGPTTGQLTYQANSHALRLTERCAGSALCVPLVFDLCPQRSKQKRTWRRLTVAETGQVIPPDAGAAFRFQIGKEQWFVYRALRSKGMRSFFGEHFSGEFLFARFSRQGEVTELLRIE